MGKIKVDQTFKGLDGRTVGTFKEMMLSKDGKQEPLLDEKTGAPVIAQFEDPNDALTLKQVIVQSINKRDIDEKTKQPEVWDQDKSYLHYCIQKKVFDAPKGGIELEASEKVAILEQVNKFQTTWIYGQVRDMLG